MTDRMATPDAAKMPRRMRRILIVLFVSAGVVVSGFLAWEFAVRPRSLAEVYGFDRWSPGSTVTIAGTITSVERENTSYGPKVYLGLDSSSVCGNVPSVVGDPSATYEI